MKSAAGIDADIPRDAYDAAALAARIRAARPRLVGFVGKNAAARFLGERSARLAYGPAAAPIDFPPIFVLPSTSGAARGAWDPRPWHALAARVKGQGS